MYIKAIDGLFVTLLLLKKKRYAAVKISNLDEVIRNSKLINGTPKFE